MMSLNSDWKSLAARKLVFGPVECTCLEAAFYLGLFSYFLWTVFSTTPFIQQEVLGLAFFWTHPNSSFLRDIFDPFKTDGYPGRFRYLEYLAEAIYWKLMKAGLFPTDLYDYSAIAATVVLAVLLHRLAQRRGVSPLLRALTVALFVLSVPVFMTGVFHFRKAKFMASLWLVVIGLLSREPAPSKAAYSLFAVGILGVLTDPFFILMAPVVTFFEDLAAKNRWRQTRWLISGMAAGLATAALLNGVIGPKFNSRCALFMTEIPHKPDFLISYKNIPYFYDLLPDLFFPAAPRGLAGMLGWAFLMGVAVCLAVYRSKLILRAPAVGTFLVALPVTAFLVLPDSSGFRFASYYGHPLFIIFVMALIDLFAAFETQMSSGAKYAAATALAVLCLFHQSGHTEVYQAWRARHFDNPKARKKFEADYAELRKIKDYISHNPTYPYTMRVDYSHVQEYSFRDIYEKGESALPRQRTYLAYFLMPVLFHRAIEDHQLVIASDIAIKFEIPE